MNYSKQLQRAYKEQNRNNLDRNLSRLLRKAILIFLPQPIIPQLSHTLKDHIISQVGALQKALQNLSLSIS